MTVMAISPNDKKLLKLISQLNNSQKKSLLDFVRSFMLKDGLMERQSVEDYNRETNHAIKNVKKGEFTSIEDLEKEMESW